MVNALTVTQPWHQGMRDVLSTCRYVADGVARRAPRVNAAAALSIWAAMIGQSRVQLPPRSCSVVAAAKLSADGLVMSARLRAGRAAGHFGARASTRIDREGDRMSRIGQQTARDLGKVATTAVMPVWTMR